MSGACAQPPAPLRTDGGFIVDAAGRRVRLAGVNWYGAESPDFVVGGLAAVDLHAIAHEIMQMGFNAVRLPWSNELVESNPVVPDYAVAANPDLKGKHAIDVLDAVVNALASEGLYIILDNHVSRADWCCKDTDGNGLWYSDAYPESAWISDWQALALRYKSQPAVAGVDLRNEVRNGATWDQWRRAAETCGNAVLGVNPNLLIIVEGVNYALDLSSAGTAPVHLNVPNRLAYSAHDYAWDHNGFTSYEQIRQQLDNRWGYLLTTGVPVWLGEFGTCNTSASCITDTKPGSQGLWFSSVRRYIAEAGVDWAYWPLNGTQSTGYSRKFGAVETYGVLDAAYGAPALPELLSSLADLTGPEGRPRRRKSR